MLWLKRHVDLEPLSIFTDKFAVRDYVREQIGSDYLIPLIGIYDHVNEIDLDALPDSFMIKTTHSSGWNIRVANKAQISWHSIKKQLKRWLSQCFYERHGEANYRGIKPRIMIEPLLSEDQGELRDYKLYFCNGKYLGAHVDFNRFSDHQYRIYDVAWNEFEKEDPNIVRNLPLCPRPEKLDEMIEIGLKLSQGFPYVRVDLYYPQGQIFSVN
ncbi:ATP-grasp fold amidoligase family protein [Candidatus Reidiella endopervernicosa]|uniref:Glycosyl transferase n=1 Tax=Candidatus Reidiella endopervernicosa TaxID=2738883 RepID=A0A6N0I0F1_9GAMM|nr:ATP-grasp fold amidoligase family protein [Candidatus Reidiella endopervernicosa]QKQ27926.1 hypothetical protein HUE57_17795 [Candidatus Reidiella endopervernicosa]